MTHPNWWMSVGTWRLTGLVKEAGSSGLKHLLFRLWDRMCTENRCGCEFQNVERKSKCPPKMGWLGSDSEQWGPVQNPYSGIQEWTTANSIYPFSIKCSIYPIWSTLYFISNIISLICLHDMFFLLCFTTYGFSSLLLPPCDKILLLHV